MIDPTRITRYDRTKSELEELILFCIAVAGKNATTTAKNLERLLRSARAYKRGSPFKSVLALNEVEPLAAAMKRYGFGCYNLKSRGFLAIAESNIDLTTCTPEELEEIPGIGLKTSRFFILHTRRGASYACLDTHVLKWLGYFSGLDVPTTTPTSRKQYETYETMFINVANVLYVSPADLDLKIWNSQRGSIPE